MNPLDRNQVRKVPFIPDRGSSAPLNSDATLLDFGRIIVERHTVTGKIRLKIGSGTGKVFLEEGYVNDGIIVRTDPTTLAMGSIPAGTVLGDKSIYEALQQAYWAYQNVNLSGLAINPSQIEIGFQLTGNMTVTCTIQNSANLASGNAGAISSELVTPQAFNPRVPLVIATIPTIYNVPTNKDVTVNITGTASGTPETSQRATAFQWLPRIIHLTNSSTNMTTGATILAAAGGGSVLSNTRQRDYDFAGNGYSHFYFPSFVDITNIGFTDIDINTNQPLFNYAVQQQSDVVINNGQISVTLKYFRSVNSFGGPTRARVS